MKNTLQKNRAAIAKFVLVTYTLAFIFIISLSFFSFSNTRDSFASEEQNQEEIIDESSEEVQDPNAIPVPNFNCATQGAPFSFNFPCSIIDTNQPVDKVAVHCPQSNVAYCVPGVNGGVEIQRENAGIANIGDNFFNVDRTRIRDNGTCGSIQVDLMRSGGYDFNSDVITGQVYSLGSDCVDSPPPEEEEVKDFSITKEAFLDEDGDKVFEVNDTITFKIVVRNTGNVAYDVVKFRDLFNNQYLGFESGRVRFFNAANEVTSVDLVQDSNFRFNNKGYLVIDDVNTLFSKNFLQPDQRYRFDLTFRALQPTVGAPITDEFIDQYGRTKNTAEGTLDGDEKIASDKVTIIAEGEELVPDFSITKTLAQGQASQVNLGENVSFNIRIQNTGETVFDVVRFTDNYLTQYIDFVNGSITDGTTTVNLSNIPANNFAIDEANGNITINDITQVFGNDFEPGEEYNLNLTFVSTATTEDKTEVMNIAVVQPDNEEEKEDDEDVEIVDDETTKSINIVKELAQGQSNQVNIGDEVRFRITITNTGDEPYNQVSFQDNFLTQYLDFNTNLFASRVVHNGSFIYFNQINQSGHLSVDESTGSIVVDDLTHPDLFNKDFMPGETYVIYLSFFATADTSNLPINQSVNVGIVVADEDEDEDDEDVEITEPALDVDKFVLNQPVGRPFFVGEDIVFQIVIENISSNYTFDVVSFRDIYDPVYLSYQSICTGVDFSSCTDISNEVDNSIAGELSIADLTDLQNNPGLGDLAPGEQFDLFVTFEAIRATSTNVSSGETRNLAIANADGFEDEDDEFVEIIDEDDVEPAQCNEACGGTVLCAEGLACIEGLCRLPSNPTSLTCEPAVVEEAILDVEKVLHNQPLGRPYRVGEEIIFQIRLENKSTDGTVFTTVELEDTFDSNYLQINLADTDTYIEQNSTGNIFNNVASVATQPNANSFVISDLTALTGMTDLQPGDWFDVFVSFTALQETSSENMTGVTTNYAIGTANNDITDEDEQDVIIDDQPVIEVVGCNETCNGTTLLCNGQANHICVIPTGASEGVCRLATNINSLTCEEDTSENDPELSVVKTVEGDGRYTLLDEPFTFNIVIRNTGDVDLSTVRFRDDYDANMLNFMSGRVEKFSNNGTSQGVVGNITTILNINDRNTGLLEVTNLVSATGFGNLRVGEYYVVRLQFVGVRPGTTTNVAIVNGRTPDGDNTPEARDNENVFIENLNTDI